MDAPLLLFGPYRPPACKEGGWLMDELYGLVQVNGFTSARFSWPTRKRPGGGPRTLALTEDLVRALRNESAVAVAYWWGISTKTVRVFRRALDVPRNTPGTLKQHAHVAVLPPPEAAAKGRAKIDADPAIRKRIGDQQRGKVMSAESRQRMSEAGRGKRKPPGWGARASAWMMEGKAKRKRALPVCGD